MREREGRRERGRENVCERDGERERVELLKTFEFDNTVYYFIRNFIIE